MKISLTDIFEMLAWTVALMFMVAVIIGLAALIVIGLKAIF